MMEQDLGIQTAADAVTSANREANKQFAKKTFESGLRVAAATAIIEAGVACTPAPVHENNPNVGLTSIPGETMTPPATEAPVSATGTPIVEVKQQAPSVMEAALAFGWRNDRQYTEGERNGQKCAFDTFNNACMATYDAATNSWIEVDETTEAGAELKYGQMVPENGTLKAGEVKVGNRYREIDVDAYYLDRYERTVTVNGESVTEDVVKVGLRDIDGTIHVAEVVYDVVGGSIVDHLSPFHFGFENSPGSDAVVGEDTGIDPLNTIQPGHHLRVHVPFPATDTSTKIAVPSLERSTNEPKANNQADIVLAELFNQNVNDQFTPVELKKVQEGFWPDRQVTIYGAAQTQIMLATENDILQYFSAGSTISQ